MREMSIKKCLNDKFKHFFFYLLSIKRRILRHSSSVIICRSRK